MPEFGVHLAAGGAYAAFPAPGVERLELCVFDGAAEARYKLTERVGEVLGGVVPLRAGARYGLRAHGPGLNPAKLLCDPWARRLDGSFHLHPSLFDASDSASAMPKAVLEAALPALAPPPLPAARVIYEASVRGLTLRHPAVPPAQRGTFAGLAHPAVLAHLTGLGITHLELLPVAAWIDERHLPPLGLENRWGYNPVALLAPDPRLAPGGMAEVRAAVAALAAAGIGVILDVVLNHTGESDIHGPTLSLRGLGGDAAWYHMRDGQLENHAGTGNALALHRAWPMRLAMDALRHWAAQGIAGFRLDLAVTLGRDAQGFDPHGAMLLAMRQDPLLRDRLMIAEPWDCGPQGYHLGRFPAGWPEWNDRFRDDTRRFWRGDAGTLGAFTTRFAGSADLFGARPATDSLNYVTAHDGFSLADLVSHAHRHNHANGEDNRDGTAENFSWNNGAEGASDDPAILASRAADARALLLLLLTARGTPMLSMGDELGRGQGGNNNAYCQDFPIEWPGDAALAGFVARLVQARCANPALHATAPLTGEPGLDGLPDVAWRHPDGGAPDWNGQALLALLAHGGNRVAVAFNAGPHAHRLELPLNRPGHVWRLLADSARPDADDVPRGLTGRTALLIAEKPRRGSRAPDDDTLRALARTAGIETHRDDAGGSMAVPVDTLRAVLAALDVPHHSNGAVAEAMRGLPPPAPARQAPERAFLPEQSRGFGLAAQSYALRREDDQGIGDYTAMRQLAEQAGRAGARLLGISPPHALMPDDRERASPYQPSDRRFLEPILIDVAALDGPGARAALQAEAGLFAALRRGDCVDYPAVWAAKQRVLRAAFAEAPPLPAPSEALLDFATFTASVELLGKPVAWEARADFRARHAEAVRFVQFQQHLAEQQFTAAGAAGAGLYRDLAVGSAPDGAEVWGSPHAYLRGFSLGVPPDRLGPEGQVWGLPALRPSAAPGHFAQLLEANMRHAAALRIDHVMALQRLFLVPEGGTGADGCYLAYPRDAMLAELTRASQRARCMVIGEDLGTVPEGLGPALERADVLSYRVLWFEQDERGLRPPRAWTAKAAACVSTHDLPTLAGWWEGADLRERQSLGLPVLDGRAAERAELLAALAESGHLPAGVTADSPFSDALAAAIHGHVAAGAPLLMLAQAEDFAGETMAVNLPGTDRERPNWRRRLSVPVSGLLETARGRAILDAIRAYR